LAIRLEAEVAECFADQAASAASARRSGYQAMLEFVRAGGVDLVLAEGLDRLSRDQEDTAALFKRLGFLGVRIVTVAEGEIGDLHVGLKGAMNALYLKNLALKTRLGLAGRVAVGRSAGGLCYGYAVVRELGADGPVHGKPRIVAEEATIVRRTFTEFAGGSSPKTIAKRLNAEGVAGPRGERWHGGTIRGHRTRGTGLLNNELYIGKLVWNRQRFVKDPESGKRLARPNPPGAWITESVPELRIVDDALWARVKARQGELDGDPKLMKAKATRFWERRRAKHLLTGLMACGVCGQAYASVGRDYLACVVARTMGVCTHRAGLKRAAVEEAILAVVK
jgi:site-specific DNA recombinase